MPSARSLRFLAIPAMAGPALVLAVACGERGLATGPDAGAPLYRHAHQQMRRTMVSSRAGRLFGVRAFEPLARPLHQEVRTASGAAGAAAAGRRSGWGRA